MSNLNYIFNIMHSFLQPLGVLLILMFATYEYQKAGMRDPFEVFVDIITKIFVCLFLIWFFTEYYGFMIDTVREGFHEIFSLKENIDKITPFTEKGDGGLSWYLGWVVPLINLFFSLVIWVLKFLDGIFIEAVQYVIGGLYISFIWIFMPFLISSSFSNTAITAIKTMFAILFFPLAVIAPYIFLKVVTVPLLASLGFSAAAKGATTVKIISAGRGIGTVLLSPIAIAIIGIAAVIIWILALGWIIKIIHGQSGSNISNQAHEQTASTSNTISNIFNRSFWKRGK